MTSIRPMHRSWLWRLGSLWLSLWLALTALALLSVRAESQEITQLAPEAQIVGVDAADNPPVAAVLTSIDDASSAMVTTDGADRQEGKAVSTFASQAPAEVVLVVDQNSRSAKGDAFGEIKSGLAEAVGNLPDSVSVAVVSAGPNAVVKDGLTTDRTSTVEAIDDIQLRSTSDVSAGLVRAAQQFTTDAQVRTVVVVSSGPSDDSAVSLGSVRSELIQAQSQVVAVQYAEVSPAVEAAVTATGGFSVSIAATAELAPMIDAVVERGSQRWMVDVAAEPNTGGRSNAKLELQDVSHQVSYLNGQTNSMAQLRPAVDVSFRQRMAATPVALVVSLLLALVAIGLAVWALSSIFLAKPALDNLLQRYEVNDPTLTEEETKQAIIQTSLMQRAVELSENIAERRGLLGRIEQQLERANLPIRPGEAVVFVAIGVILSTVLGWALSQSIIGAVIVAIAVAALCYFAPQLLATRRLRKFESQLPDTLQLLAGTLRAGFSLPQGIDAVSKEIAPPMGTELKRAVTEARLGRELHEALESIGDRLSSPDFAWAVLAIGIQREVGGNLNELLSTVSNTMLARDRLRREINALTAEGRMSALILGLMPPGLAVVMMVLNPDYIGILFSSFLGNVVVGGAVLSVLIGLAWMKKVITLDV